MVRRRGNANAGRIRHGASLSSLLLVPAICTSIFSCLPVAEGYIPALPINDTSRLNLTDTSTISISWVLPAGVYQGPVSYQLQADVPTGGQTDGALVHFTESTMGPNQTTTTPWIAYISCDVNETDASQEWDIFTLARDRGAVSALLYSPSSQSCLLNSEYITDFEKPLDVFATETLQVARIINGQFLNTNETFYYYNGSLLNSSSNAVNLSLAGTPLQQRTFLIGTLTARNSTGQLGPTGIPNPGNDDSSDSDGGRSGQPPAMIALYVVTGCISAMFALMIVMAARRAIRHPERYGRREGNENEAPQTRAGGIAQALLDTFPVIKFNRRDTPKDTESETEMETRQVPHAERRVSRHPHVTSAGTTGAGTTTSDPFDDRGEGRHSPSVIERNMASASPDTGTSLSYHPVTLARKGEAGDGDDDDDTSVKSVEMTDYQQLQPRPPPPSSAGPPADPTAATAETPGDMEEQCPICLIDFEDGDDLRVLPCEREHVYHQTCIDPWLLDVSSSCPLCRKDFNQPPEPNTATASSTSSTNQPPTASGFAKYLAFMRREKRAGRSRASTAVSHGSGSGSGSASGSAHI